MDLAKFQKMTIASDREEAPVRRLKGKISFPDLPGELRNQIYHFAMENVPQKVVFRADRGLPTIGRRRNRPGQRTKPEQHERLRVPYLGLMQTCKAIRSEFRPLYFNQIGVPMRSMPSVIFAFIEHPQMPMKIALYTFQQSVRRICLMATPCDGLDILPLLRLQAHRRTLKVDIQPEPGFVRSSVVLAHIINNSNEKWLHWIKTGVIWETELSIRHEWAFLVAKVRRNEVTFHATVGPGASLSRMECDDRLGLGCPGL